VFCDVASKSLIVKSRFLKISSSALVAMTYSFSFPRFPRKVILLALTSACFGKPQAFAQTDSLWHGSIAIGGTFAQGNADTQTFTVLADAVRATEMGKTSLNSVVNYGSTQRDNVTTRTARLFKFGARYDYDVTHDIFSFAGANAETNKVQNISSRYTSNLGLGYKAIRTPQDSLDLFAGLGYSSVRFEKTTPPASPSIAGAELFIAEESTHKLSPTATLKQRWAAYPGQAALGLRSTFDSSLSTAVAGNWTLNVGWSTSYSSKPSAGFKKRNSLLTFGFGTKF
jgi:putative salt-induced outer membrane protein